MLPRDPRGIIIETENINNILNTKRRLLLKLTLRRYATIAVSVFCYRHRFSSPRLTKHLGLSSTDSWERQE